MHRIARDTRGYKRITRLVTSRLSLSLFFPQSQRENSERKIFVESLSPLLRFTLSVKGNPLISNNYTNNKSVVS